MTRNTALALITRMDIDRELLACNRGMTPIDRLHLGELWDRVYVEDVLLDGYVIDATDHITKGTA